MYLDFRIKLSESRSGLVFFGRMVSFNCFFPSCGCRFKAVFFGGGVSSLPMIGLLAAHFQDFEMRGLARRTVVIDDFYGLGVCFW